MHGDAGRCGAGPAAPSVEDVAAAFWAPAREIFAEQATAIADQIGQLLTETEAQRAAREQVEYEERLAGQRARMDGAFAKVGESAAERAERHRVEDVLVPGPAGRDDFVALVDRLADRLTETPEDRARREETERETEKRRLRAREDKRLADAGETPAQRTRRHRRQRLADQREAGLKARRQRRRAARVPGPTDRTRRFRRWCALTAISATCGYTVGLVPLVSPGGPFVGLLLAGAGWALDLHMRDRGRMRVSEVTRPGLAAQPGSWWPAGAVIDPRFPVLPPAALAQHWTLAARARELGAPYGVDFLDEQAVRGLLTAQKRTVRRRSMWSKIFALVLVVAVMVGVLGSDFTYSEQRRQSILVIGGLVATCVLTALPALKTHWTWHRSGLRDRANAYLGLLVEARAYGVPVPVPPSWLDVRNRIRKPS
ncbi:hypothetical protein ACIQOV_23475 [Kitasatospora sp. NPDC091257]|uniref:hypothetical protein n=1 Tax=Kitasatospora sp. NPDC091257 TaxID=3364084 RepID=UPI0037FEEC7C